MDTRYTDPLVTRLWSPESQYQLWTKIEWAVAVAQGEHDVVPKDEATTLADELSMIATQITAESVAQITQIERQTRHDVAAFLQWLTSRIDERALRPNKDGGPVPDLFKPPRWLHWGLTSSDVVDTALGLRFKQVEPHLNGLVGDLMEVLFDLEESQTPLLGHTHGQPAEPTSIGLRAMQWRTTFARATELLDGTIFELCVAKMSGPVGSYSHNTPDVEGTAAELLGLRPAMWLVPTQVIPRDLLAFWAQAARSVVAACGKIALDIRLMAARGEVREKPGRAQVGSSSMPHKNNPITAEQICGMVRLADGYAVMLQPIDLWEDRDISHSSVERVAVPDLWHVLLHTLRQTHRLLSTLEYNDEVIRDNLYKAGRLPYTAWRANALVRGGMDRQAAHSAAKRWADWEDSTGELVEAAKGLQSHPTPEAMVREHPMVKAIRQTAENKPLDTQSNTGVGSET